jgi:metal-responsive CopG/Arc/MetJ family transcriptional regulator
MPKTKVAVTLDAHLLRQVDDLVVRQKFWNRSQAVEAVLAEKLHRIGKRLAESFGGRSRLC